MFEQMVHIELLSFKWLLSFENNGPVIISVEEVVIFTQKSLIGPLDWVPAFLHGIH
jgi:hypothetical protein